MGRADQLLRVGPAAVGEAVGPGVRPLERATFQLQRACTLFQRTLPLGLCVTNWHVVTLLFRFKLDSYCWTIGDEVDSLVQQDAKRHTV